MGKKVTQAIASNKELSCSLGVGTVGISSCHFTKEGRWLSLVIVFSFGRQER